MNRRTMVLAWILTGLTLPLPARAEPQAPARFEDPINGYALRPPRGASRVDPDAPEVLARWVITGPQGRKTLLQLDVQKIKPESTPVDLETWKKEVIENMARTQGVEVVATTIRTVGGLGALEVIGRIRGKTEVTMTGQKVTAPTTEFRQLWLLQDPQTLLLIKLDASDIPELNVPTIWSRLVASVTTNDPKEFLRQQEQGLIPARTLLETLTIEKLDRAMPADPQWFLLEEEGDRIGWQMLLADRVRRDDKPGWRVRQWSMIARPDQPIVLIQQVAFIDNSLQAGAWRRTVQIGQGRTSRLVVVEGIRNEQVISAGFGQPDEMARRKGMIPAIIQPIFLPTAVGMILPRLVDSAQGRRYTFGTYDASTDTFPMRIFSLEGTEVMKHNGRMIRAIKARDRREFYHEPVTVYLDESGTVLLERNQQGHTVRAVDGASVLREFPRPSPKTIIRALNSAYRKSYPNEYQSR